MIVVAAQARAVAFRTALGLVDILDNASIDGCLYPAEHQGRVSRLVRCTGATFPRQCSEANCPGPDDVPHVCNAMGC